jgi:hypothetical protein
MSELSPPRIVCAAIQLATGLIVPSARHLDMTMRLVIASIGAKTMQGSIQGFIDQHGQFYTREQAWPIALANEQIRRRVGGDDGRLYSENLY